MARSPRQAIPVQIASIESGTEKFVRSIDLIKHIVTMLVFLGCVIAVGTCLVNLATADEKSLNALALVVEHLKLDTIASYIFGAGAAGAAVIQTGRLKRAIREKHKYQQRAEAGEQNRTSSGIAVDGGPPENG